MFSIVDLTFAVVSAVWFAEDVPLRRAASSTAAMLLVTPPSTYINLDRFLIWSATRVAPAVRTCATRCVAVVAAGFCLLLERLRVWENTVEGARSNSVSKVMVIRFKVCFSSAAVLRWTAIFRWRVDCTKDQRGC